MDWLLILSCLGTTLVFLAGCCIGAILVKATYEEERRRLFEAMDAVQKSMIERFARKED